MNMIFYKYLFIFTLFRFVFSAEEENIALYKPASQSSTESDWTASRSVDGCTNQTAVSQCCSKTLAEADNELEVTLGALYTIGKVVVYGQTDGEDELAGFQLYYGDILKLLVYDNDGKPYGNGIFEIMLQPPLNISTLTIRRTNDTVSMSLTVCEIQVYEVAVTSTLSPVVSTASNTTGDQNSSGCSDKATWMFVATMLLMHM